MNPSQKISFSNHRSFMSLHEYGHSPHGSSFLVDQDQSIRAFFTNSRHDTEVGNRSHTSVSYDQGRTWSRPAPLGPVYEGDPLKQTVLTGCGLGKKTIAGTLVINGFHMELEADNQTKYGSTKQRPYTFIIGRMEKGQSDYTYKKYPSGTFSAEQFVEGGVQFASGRLLYTIWGAKHWGENWRCGVLISDDDAKNFRYSNVGYEPDPAIRWNTDQPAGFNEQSLFVLDDRKIVSIIRARHHLGEMKDSPKDTFFYRSISHDQGETWSKPVITDVPGTGAASVGSVLPDGSLLHACRLPYHRTYYNLNKPNLYGLHFVRSFDEGLTWKSEHMIQQSPAGVDYTHYYNTMNGQFITIDDTLTYTYGFRNHDDPSKCYIAAVDIHL